MVMLKNPATYDAKKGIYDGKPEKTLTVALKNKGGRNSKGRITCYGVGNKGKKENIEKLIF